MEKLAFRVLLLMEEWQMEGNFKEMELQWLVELKNLRPELTKERKSTILIDMYKIIYYIISV